MAQINYVPSDGEPEGVKSMGEQYRHTDAKTVLKIWTDLKWGCKSINSVEELRDLIATAIHNANRQIIIQVTKREVVERFQAMLDRVNTGKLDIGPELCPTCELPLFICPCPKPSTN